MFTFYILIRSVLFIANLHVLKLHITKQECRKKVFFKYKINIDLLIVEMKTCLFRRLWQVQHNCKSETKNI